MMTIYKWMSMKSQFDKYCKGGHDEPSMAMKTFGLDSTGHEETSLAMKT